MRGLRKEFATPVSSLYAAPAKVRSPIQASRNVLQYFKAGILLFGYLCKL